MRIFSFYQNQPSAADAARFLKEEYGYSGHSYSFLDGSSGFISYAPSTGLSIEHSESHTKTKVSWKSVEQRIRLMMREGTYLTPEEQMQYVSDHLEDNEETLTKSSHVEEMLEQAELAAELSEQTGQNLFAFEAGNQEPVNLPHETKPAEPPIISSVPATTSTLPMTPLAAAVCARSSQTIWQPFNC